jgi:hypothetical protein
VIETHDSEVSVSSDADIVKLRGRDEVEELRTSFESQVTDVGVANLCGLPNLKRLDLSGSRQFVADFGHLPIARVVYEGKLTGTFADDVRSGKFGVVEGVVCKGGEGGSDLWMAKIKTHAYMARLKQAFADRWEEYWE